MASSTAPCSSDYAMSKASADFSFPLAVLNFSFSALSTLASLVGNMLLVVAMFRFPELREVPSNLLMFSLAVSGLLIGCIVQPIYSVRLLSSLTGGCLLPENFLLENFVFYCSYVFLYSSTVSICIITIERYICIAHSLHYLHVVTESRMMKVIAAEWVVSMFLASLRFIPSFPAVGMKAITSTLAVVALLLVFVCYSRIMKLSRGHERQLKDANVFPHHAPNQHDFHGTNTTLIVIGSLFLAYVPLLLLRFLHQIPNQALQNVIDVLQPIAATIYLMNSSLNPYVYLYRSKIIRWYVVQSLRKG